MPSDTADAALLKVLATARSFLSCRAQVTEIVSGRAPPARNLGEAIDRDFLFFDLERAAQALREAVEAVPGGAEAPRPIGNVQA
jgi:hypothetical protein